MKLVDHKPNTSAYEKFVNTAIDLGVEISGTCTDVSSDVALVFLGYFSENNWTLAKAISDVSKDVRVCVGYARSGGIYVLENQNLIPLNTCNRAFDYTLSSTANAYNFQDICDNKVDMNATLLWDSISTPKQKHISCQPFLSAHDFISLYSLVTQLVSGFKHPIFKPVDGFGGHDVVFLEKNDVGTINSLGMLDTENCPIMRIGQFMRSANVDAGIVEERVFSYPLYINNKKKDWNLRVLVTYCPEKQDYIVAGITGRIDDDGGPVNRSISADNISFDQIVELAGWNEKDASQIQSQVIEVAIKSVHSIARSGIQRAMLSGIGNDPAFMKTNFQDISGVDIIVNPEMKVVVGEVNHSHSGCIYDLFKNEGLDAIIPIARSIVHKVDLMRQEEQRVYDARMAC